MLNNRFAKVAALDVKDDVLPWVWALHTQEVLWLDHDARWVRQAAGEWPDDQVHRFLSSYGLLRGVRGKLLSGDRETGKDKAAGTGQIARNEFKRLAKEYASGMKVGNAAHNTAQWLGFDQAFYKFCADEGWLEADGNAIPNINPNVGGWFMPSATLKAMWFHAPDMAPLYDDYAMKGLRKIYGTRNANGPNDFLKPSYNLLAANEELIEKAKSIWGRSYPHTIRIVDKFLWLKGSGNLQVISEFHAGCVDLSK